MSSISKTIKEIMGNKTLTDSDKRKILISEIRFISQQSTNEILKLCNLMSELEDIEDQKWLDSLISEALEGDKND